MKRENNKGITLIALIITIILMLILAGVVLSLTLSDNGLIKVTMQTAKKTNEEEAREKLQLALEDLRIQQYSNEEYNENEYVNRYLKNNAMNINGNVVNVNGYSFIINRETLEILDNFENQEIEKVFSYTGNIEKYVVERSGKYKLEVWGAAGGGTNGGKGGYSIGEINFQKGDEIYICIGEKGGRNQGGYNGGGSGTYVAGGVYKAGYGGGGATHIATTNRGVLSNYLEYKSEILIVAGAGGGSSESNDHGGDGGGESGTSGSGSYVGGGANQTSPGAKGDYDSVTAGFGYGGSAPYGNTTTGTYGGGGRRCRMVWRRSFKPSKWEGIF